MDEQQGQSRPDQSASGGRHRRDPVAGELGHRVAILEAAAAIGEAASLELDSLLAHVCRQTATSLSCPRAAVYLRDDGLSLAHLHDTGGRTWPNDGGQAAEELARRTPVVGADPRFTPYLDGPWGVESGAASVVALPLGEHGEERGLLVAARTDATVPFTEHDHQVGAAIARQATRAIANAQHHERAQEAVARLEERDRLRADHVTGLVHDLRTPLTGLLGLVWTLRGPGAAATAVERAEQLDAIARQGHRLAGMIDDILLSAREEFGALAPDEVRPVTVADLLGPALEVYDAERRSRLHIRIDDAVAVRGDRDQLLRVVQNLLDNALRYSPLDAPVTVRVGRDGGDALLEVSDRGEGIPAEQVPLLFQRFTPGRRRPGSTGFGLYVVREIIVAHRGTVDVTSADGGGTTVSVRLPAVT